MKQPKSTTMIEGDATEDRSAADDDQVVEAACRIVEAGQAQFSRELMDLITTLHQHPEMFAVQAKFLHKRFEALKAAGFSEEFARQIILQFGLKKDLIND